MVITDPPLFAASTSPSDTTRRANLSLVLSLVHHRGALSRADLTRATGLNRSTIATLVGPGSTEAREAADTIWTLTTDPTAGWEAIYPHRCFQERLT